MKTTFRRVFVSAAAILLVAMLIVGLSFQFLAHRYMQEWSQDNLKREAEALVQITTDYVAKGELTGRDFYLSLRACTDATGSDAVICDGLGRLVLCSDAPEGCEHIGLAVDKVFLNKIKTEGCYETVGMVKGLYPERRTVVALPVYDNAQNIIGIVLVSAPATDIRDMFWDMTKIYLVVALLVLIAALTVMVYSARRISRPLRNMAEAAVDFGQGNLEARVPVAKRSPVEIQELTHAFNNMATSLERSEKQRREFVSNVSHELKTPMTTIGGYVDGILDGTIPPEDQEKYLSLVSDETKRLHRLVRSMLDMSRVQSYGAFPESQKTRFDACECAGRVLLSFEQKIVEKKMQVGVTMPEEPVYTFAGQDAITQVLYNLLDNAVKFCPEGGVLLLGLTTREDKILITVENDGPTIPPEELECLFDRFHKTDKSRSRDKEGWGLGLAIAKSIMDSHGEEIRVRSVNNKTAFTVTMPIAN